MKSSVLVLCLLGSITWAQQPPAKQKQPRLMTVMKVVLKSKDIASTSFAAKPKVMYRAGTRYCRVEEMPDPDHNIHGLTIINEPDAWLINLATNTAQHILDTGPTFNCRLPVFSDALVNGSPKGESSEIFKLEFGRELEYFKSEGATGKPGPVLQSEQTTAYMLKIGESSLFLIVHKDPQFPIAVAWDRDGTRETFWYSKYGHVPFDAKLFSVPKGIKISEAK